MKMEMVEMGEQICRNNDRKQRTSTQPLFGHKNKTRKDKTQMELKLMEDIKR